MLCHHAKVAKTFWCCSHRLCFLQCDWWKEISLQKVINVNEARGIGWMSPDPLLSRVESAHETMVWREKVCCNSPSLLSSTHDLYTTRQSVKSQSNETIHTQRGGGVGQDHVQQILLTLHSFHYGICIEQRNTWLQQTVVYRIAGYFRGWKFS